MSMYLLGSGQKTADSEVCESWSTTYLGISQRIKQTPVQLPLKARFWSYSEPDLFPMIFQICSLWYLYRAHFCCDHSTKAGRGRESTQGSSIILVALNIISVSVKKYYFWIILDTKFAGNKYLCQGLYWFLSVASVSSIASSSTYTRMDAALGTASLLPSVMSD